MPLTGTLGDGPGTMFGFTVRATTSGPVGELRVLSGTDRMEARTIEDLVVVDATATWTGAASWNGIAGFRYRATATDGADAAADRPASPAPPDRLTITVYGPSGAIVWGADWPVRSGDIVVHVAGSEPDGDTDAIVAVLGA